MTDDKSEFGNHKKSSTNFKMLRLLQEVDFKDKYLIIPSVSVGNIGQLAVDLLISSLQLEKVGVIWNPAIIPVVGPDPYNIHAEDLIATGCELYAAPGRPFLVIQLRSGLDPKLAKKFLTELTDLINVKQLKQVILLTSCFDFEKHTIKSSDFRYLANEENDPGFSKIKTLGWEPLRKSLNAAGVETGDDYHINGGGFALKLYQELSEKKVNSLLIMKYCSEGDNVPDSLDLVKLMDDYLQLFDNLSTQIVFPPSWDLLFGNPPPDGIY